MLDISSVDLSRLQFGITALYHFIFVPLTLGLSFILAIMESIYVMTGRAIWKDMTKFWGILFGINFAMGVATGVPLEFQFGTNWSYYSHYVGDVFGSLLAIEGLMAFFLEATFIGLFYFGWERLSRVQHLVVTWLVAIGSNLSALWILLANGWMQNPVGARFNPDTMRMELSSFYDVLFNPVSQSKVVHTVSAGYVTGAMFVLSISAFYLIRDKYTEFARRSMAVASSFGLAAAISVVILGDESGYTATQHQTMKIAALEGMWETEPAPASFTVFAILDSKNQVSTHEIRIPWVLGLMATRSLTQEIPGIKELVGRAEKRIQNGMVAWETLQKLREDPANTQLRSELEKRIADLGHGLLLKRYTPNVVDATSEQIKKAALDTVPNVPLMFWSFRIMVACGFWFILVFGFAFYMCSRGYFNRYEWFYRVALYSLPLPWVASEVGWIVAECGRQPWTIDGILPTFLSASTVPASHVWTTLIAFVTFYSVLLFVDIMLMKRYIKMGPVSALTGGKHA